MAKHSLTTDPPFSTAITLPKDVIKAEGDAIKERRRVWAALKSPPSEEPPAEIVGLALSGGGVRSASYCLGILQGLHRRGLLRFVDYLSTVSGGGYAGAYVTSSIHGRDEKQFDPQRHLNKLLGPPDASAPATTPKSNEPLVGIQQLEHRGKFLVQTLKFANYGTISIVLLWVFMLTGLCAYANFTAWLFRNLDYSAVRSFLNPLGVQDDVTLAFFPCAVLSLLFLLAWFCSALRYGPRCTGRWAKPFLIAAAYTFAVAGVSLLVTGDLSATHFDAWFGPGAAKEVWAKFGSTATNVAIAAFTASLLPFLQPQALLRSGYAPRGQLHEWIFTISSYALLVGVPLMAVAFAAKEDRTGLYRNRTDLRLEFVDIRDWSDPEPARNAFWTDMEQLVEKTKFAGTLDPKSDLEDIEDLYKERRALVEQSPVFHWDRHFPGMEVHALEREARPLPNRISARVGCRAAVSSGLSFLMPFADRSATTSYQQLTDNIHDILSVKRSLTNDLNRALIRPDFWELLASPEARPEVKPRRSAPHRDSRWEDAFRKELNLVWDHGKREREQDPLPRPPLLDFATDGQGFQRLWFGPFGEERIQQTSHFVIPYAMPDDELEALKCACEERNEEPPDADRRQALWEAMASAAPLDKAWTATEREFAESLRIQLKAERERLLAQLAANRRLLTAYYTTYPAPDPKASAPAEGVSKLQAPTTVFSWVVLEADQQSRWNAFVLSGLAFLVVGFVLTDLNMLSWHGYYREQIQQTWMPDLSRSRPVKLEDCHPDRFGLPYPLINAAVHQNHFATEPDRSPRDFLFSPAYCGSEAVGFIPTAEVSNRKRRGFDLPDAVAVSGGAVSPLLVQNMLVRILMFLGNMRFGQWVANPGASPHLWRPLRRWLPLGPLAVMAFWVRVHVQQFLGQCWRLGWDIGRACRVHSAPQKSPIGPPRSRSDIARAVGLLIAAAAAAGYLLWWMLVIRASLPNGPGQFALLLLAGTPLLLTTLVAAAILVGWCGSGTPDDQKAERRNGSARFGGLYCFATDGGHFDNTGLDVLLQRRCRVIFAADVTDDKLYRFGDLNRLIRRWQTKHPDFDIEWQPLIDDEEQPNGLDVLKPRIDTEKEKDHPDPKVLRLQPAAKRPFAVGLIRYPKSAGNRPPEQGLLIYFKPTLTNGLPQDVRQFSDDNPLFPQEPTSDIVYEYEQFESYRKLGEQAVEAFDDAVTSGRPPIDSVSRLRDAVESRLRNAPPRRTPAAARSEWTRRAQEHRQPRKTPAFETLVSQLWNAKTSEHELISAHSRLVDCGPAALSCLCDKLTKGWSATVNGSPPQRELAKQLKWGEKLLNVAFDIIDPIAEGPARVQQLRDLRAAIDKHRWLHRHFDEKLDELRFGSFSDQEIDVVVELYHAEQSAAPPRERDGVEVVTGEMSDNETSPGSSLPGLAGVPPHRDGDQSLRSVITSPPGSPESRTCRSAACRPCS